MRLWLAARRQDAKAKHPRDMKYLITLLYSRALRPAPRAGISLSSVFVSEGPGQLLTRYAQRAAVSEVQPAGQQLCGRGRGE